MSPKRFDMTHKKKLPFSYLHYGILIFAQGVWAEREKQGIIDKKNTRHRDLPNVYRTNFPTSCNLCTQIHEIFVEIKGNNDGLMYVGHTNLELAEIELITTLFMTEQKVKKIYFFQGGPVKRTEVGKKQNLRERLIPKKCNVSDFIEILNDKKFEEEILYEVTKDSYF